MKLRDLVNLDLVKTLTFSVFNNEQKHIGGGIYRLLDKKGKVIYVGKSGDLHTRLHNHFQLSTHTAYFMSEVVGAEWHRENNPIFQTLLESIFIAYHNPKYNDEIKDALKLREGNRHKNGKK